MCKLEKTDKDGEIAFFDAQSKLESDTPYDKNIMTVKVH